MHTSVCECLNTSAHTLGDIIKETNTWTCTHTKSLRESYTCKLMLVSISNVTVHHVNSFNGKQLPVELYLKITKDL